MEAQGEELVTYSGILSSAGSKFGFIQCAEVKEVYNDDVWVGWMDMQGIQVGDSVDFELGFSDKGKPQALNTRLSGASPPERKGGAKGAGKSNGEFQAIAHKYGTITVIGAKFGFIDCPPVKAEYGVDVFCHITNLVGFYPGDVVEFDLGLNDKGQPQAANLRPRGSGKGASGKGGCSKGGCSKGGAAGKGTPPGAAAAAGSKGSWDTFQWGDSPGSAGGGKGSASAASTASNVLTSATGEAVTFTGVVSAAGSKFGFIQCPEVHMQYNCDVFCDIKLLTGINVGEAVDFSLALNAKGQPQAANVRKEGTSAAKVVPAIRAGTGIGLKGGGKGCSNGKDGGQVAENRYFGTISIIGAKYGFIVCPPLKAQYGADVFVPAGFLNGFQIGDSVEFDLGFNDKGQPQASHLSPHGFGKGGAKGCKGGKMMGKAAGGKGFKGKAGGGPVVPTGERYTGTLSASGPKFGFIQCPEIKALYGEDVFAHAGQIANFNVGDAVEFELQVTHEGKPQARGDLTLATGDPSGWGAPSRKRKLDQTQWLV